MRRAVTSGGNTVRFPVVDLSCDIGGRVEEAPDGVDYRGFQLEFVEVAGASPTIIRQQAGVPDFLHIDLQGAEQDLFEGGGLAVVLEGAGVVALGTHSRLIEDLAFRFFSREGFVLVGESPCVVRPDSGRLSLIQDGEQLWIGPDALALAERAGLVNAAR